jgi:hypothetical protein
MTNIYYNKIINDLAEINNNRNCVKKLTIETKVLKSNHRVYDLNYIK